LNLVFTREQNELRAVVADVLDSFERGGRMAEVAETPGNSALWAQLVELGVTGIVVPQQFGGAGYGPVELVAVAEVLGRHALPVPVLATAGLFVPAVAAAGAEAAADVLAAVAGGRAATLAVDADDPFALAAGDLVAELAGADYVAVAVEAAGARRLAVLPVDALQVDPVESVDPTRPLARLSIAARDGLQLLGGDPGPGIAVGLAALAAELVGLADALLAAGVDHARTREQFGRPIGSFQGVKHRLVDVCVLLERARSLVYHAAAAGGARRARRAKAAASEAALVAARSAVQVHGGTGVTREHRVSRLYLRAQQAAALYGGAAHHYSALSDRVRADRANVQII
jgi:alkylation response protein AidB-like acyl-CoA dehydrogenase